MQVIKPILVVCFLLVLLAFFRNRGRVELRAGTRVVALVLGLLAIVSIIDTDIPQAVAEFLGVGRGTDLILYLLVIVFTMTSLGLYFRLRAADIRMHTLARQVALSDAVRAQGVPGSAPPPTRGRDADGGEPQA